MTKKKKLTTTNTEDAWCEDFWWRKHARLGSGNLCVFSWKIRTSFGVRLTSPTIPNKQTVTSVASVVTSVDTVSAD